MTIWLLCAYGPIPGEHWRDHRYAIIGNALAAAGHDVIWWTANFSHHFKRFRSAHWKDLRVEERFSVRLVPTSSYSRNISFGRLRFELLFAWRTYWRALGESRPDCIMVTDPPQVVGRISVWLGRRFRCPVIFDAIDLWPELFSLALPPRLRAWAPALFSPLYLLRGRNYSHAAAVISLCETYRRVVLRHIPAPRQITSMTIFNGIDVAQFRESMQRIGKLPGLPVKSSGEIWAIYAGSLGVNYDLPTVMEAAALLERRGASMRIVVAGEGPLAATLKAFIRERSLNNLTYLGSLSPDDLALVYKQCDVGICPYGPLSNVAMPDKAYDYMAAGLPFVNSLKGELADYIHTQGIGLPYRAGDASSLADSLEAIADNPSFRHEMAARSRDCAMQFDRRSEYGRLVDMIGELVRQPIPVAR
jgi:glycosyltransferase involved in cell wall biosynthesis